MPHQITNHPDNVWETSLWHQICPHANLYQLHQAIGNKQFIIMASNASVNHKGYGTAAWIIYSRWNLWFGKGIAPGPMTGMYSRLAEAYWVHTGFSFANCGSNKQWSKTSLFAYQARKCSCGFTKRSHISLRQWLRPFVVLGWEQYLTGTASWIL